MRIGVPKETAAGEKRVATVPEVVEKLVKLGFTVAVESGAGDAANFADDTYRAAGAEVLGSAAPRSCLRQPTSGPGRTSCSRCAHRAPSKPACCAKAPR